MCPNCGVWEVLESDNFCSWCSHKFISLEVGIRPQRFTQNDIPPPAQLTIENHSTQNAVVLQSVTARESWISIDLGGVPLPHTLGPGQKRVVAVEIDPLDLDEEYSTGRIVVCSNAGSRSVDVEIVPAPEVNITTGEYEIFLDNLGLEETFAHVQVLHGVVTVLAVSAAPCEWVKVRPVEEVHFPLNLDARGRNSLDLRFIVDEDYLLKHSSKYPAVYEGSLKVTYLEFERIEPFRVRCWKPPQLWIWEERSPIVKAYAGKRGELTLSLQNKLPGDPAGGQGNAALEIRGIEILNADGTENRWLHPPEPFAGGIRIEGGELLQLRFAFHTQGSGPDTDLQLPIGRHFARIVLRTNMSEPRREIRFEVQVERLPIYDGVLALDFGTSNTCCAILGRRQDRFLLLPIDSSQHSQRPTTTPTIIQYCDILQNGERACEIGALVEARYGDPRVIGSTVRSPKRHLGRSSEEHKFEVRFFYNSEKEGRFCAREVVADYLKRVRAVAEEHGGALFKHLLVTHPARFRMNQLRDLEAAVHEAFGADCEITKLQEPVAAALDFIVSAEALANEHYTLGVFDFGGGTTDLSLLHVDNIREHGFREIRVRLASSSGKWFGGEDLTDFVLRHGLARCRTLAEGMRQQSEIFVEPKLSTDPVRNWLARQNQAALLRWAEATKLLLLEHGDAHKSGLPAMPGVFPMLKLNVCTPVAVEELSFPHGEIVPSQRELHEYLESEIASLAGLLALLLEKSEYERLDYLLLSGKSSVIPLVKEVLARQFMGCSVQMASEPKECVVSGACILEKFQDASEMILNIETTAATPSRIGIESVGAGGTRGFQEWIGAGVPIPPEGLACRRPFLLGRREIRLLENDSDEDALWIMAKQNPHISELGIYALESPSDQLPYNRRVPGTLELSIFQNLEVSLTGWVEGHDEPLRFVRRGEST